MTYKIKTQHTSFDREGRKVTMTDAQYRKVNDFLDANDANHRREVKYEVTSAGIAWQSGSQVCIFRTITKNGGEINYSKCIVVGPRGATTKVIYDHID